MSNLDELETKAKQEEENKNTLLAAERVRLSEKLYKRVPFLSNDYKNLIKHTGGLLTSSMTYAYTKGLQDAVTFILKENNNENVQE